MRAASAAMVELSRDQLPEMALATSFEREILNARIHFIYHVTIQKPGHLEAGWERFRKARDLMSDLSAKVASAPALAGLKTPTAELSADLDRYEAVLRQVLEVVAKGQNTGPAFAALLTEWASMGGRVVNGAAGLAGNARRTPWGPRRTMPRT